MLGKPKMLARHRPGYALWRDNDVARHADGLKRIRHPEHGLIELEFSAFAVDGRPDLGMIVYNPATAEAARRIQALVAGSGHQGSPSEGSEAGLGSPNYAGAPCLIGRSP